MTEAASSGTVPAKTPHVPATKSKNGRHSFFYDVFRQWGAFIGVVAGVGIGFWAAYRHAVRVREGVVLTSDIGAAIGLLAVSLAAMTIVLAFLNGIYKRVIAKYGGPEEFFRPFELVAVLSGAAAITGIVSSLESNVTPLNLSSALFGLSVGLLTWAIVQSVQLVFVLAEHGIAWFNLDKAVAAGFVQAASETRVEQEEGSQKVTLTLTLPQSLTRPPGEGQPG